MPRIQLADGFSSDDVSEDGVIEVDASQVSYGEDETPDGYLAKDTVEKEVIPARLNRERRLERKKLKGDDEFWAEMAEARGLELRDDGLPKGSSNDAELRDLRKTKSQYEALQGDHEAVTKELESIRSKALRSDILQAGSDVKESLTEAFAGHVAQSFTWDSEEDAYVTKGEVEYVVSDGKSRPKSPADAVAALRESAPDWFKSKSAKSSGYEAAGGSGSGKRTYTREEYEAKMKRSHELSQDEWNDLLAADEEGRVQG